MLEHQRLEAGNFDVASAPYPLVRCVQSMLGGVRIATNAKKLGLVVELDPRFDELASQAGFGRELYVVGDEVRLRQVISNLCRSVIVALCWRMESVLTVPPQ